MVDPNLSSQTMNDSPLREIYVSTDIETDGPVAGKHSMLSIGSAAYLALASRSHVSAGAILDPHHAAPDG